MILKLQVEAASFDYLYSIMMATIVIIERERVRQGLVSSDALLDNISFDERNEIGEVDMELIA